MGDLRCWPLYRRSLEQAVSTSQRKGATFIAGGYVNIRQL
jgi:hypothetical protein